MLFTLDRSFSAAVNTRVKAWDLPSRERSYLPFWAFYTFIMLPWYCPGSGPSLGFNQDLWKRLELLPNGPSFTPCSSCWLRSSLFWVLQTALIEQWRGLFMSM